MLFIDGNVDKKFSLISFIGAEKITFLQNVSGRHADRQMDISNYRVALILKKY